MFVRTNSGSAHFSNLTYSVFDRKKKLAHPLSDTVCRRQVGRDMVMTVRRVTCACDLMRHKMIFVWSNAPWSIRTSTASPGMAVARCFHHIYSTCRHSVIGSAVVANSLYYSSSFALPFPRFHQVPVRSCSFHRLEVDLFSHFSNLCRLLSSQYTDSSSYLTIK
jgi:hypothetical protein